MRSNSTRNRDMETRVISQLSSLTKEKLVTYADVRQARHTLGDINNFLQSPILQTLTKTVFPDKKKILFIRSCPINH